MSENIPAFPLFVQHENGDHYATDGMTLRDYFAGKAMQGLMGRVWNADNKLTDLEIIELWARSAYACADALLAARSK